jgi:DNA processing protein
MLSRRGGRACDIRLYSEDEAEGELAAAEALDAHLVAIGELGYPPALAEVDAPPPLLYVKGNLDLAGSPIVALVGARNGHGAPPPLPDMGASERERVIAPSDRGPSISTS